MCRLLRFSRVRKHIRGMLGDLRDMKVWVNTMKQSVIKVSPAVYPATLFFEWILIRANRGGWNGRGRALPQHPSLMKSSSIWQRPQHTHLHMSRHPHIHAHKTKPTACYSPTTWWSRDVTPKGKRGKKKKLICSSLFERLFDFVFVHFALSTFHEMRK